MKRVNRPAKPAYLARNEARLLERLNELCEERNGHGSDLEKKIKRAEQKYNHRSVKEALNTMYRELCCYCECTASTDGFSAIEHRKPRRDFPELTFDWQNLHLSCTPCNGAKADQWNEKHPILDAAADKVDDHLTYDDDDYTILVPRNRSMRGDTTIVHAKLNRPRLKAARREIAHEFLNTLTKIRKLSGDPKVRAKVEKIDEMVAGPLGSLVSYLRDVHLSDEVLPS